MKNAKNACFSHFLDRFCEKPCKKGQKSTKKVPKPFKNQHFGECLRQNRSEQQLRSSQMKNA